MSAIQSLNKNRLQFFCVILPSIIFLLTGCSMVSGTRHADGRLVVTSWRWLWKSEAIRFSAVDSNFTATLEIGRSTTDPEAVGAVAEAAVKAALKSVVPVP